MQAKRKFFAALEREPKCERCGYDRYLGALDFHHTDPSRKRFNLRDTSRSITERLKEARHCEVLCKNCHLEHHSRPAHRTAGRPRSTDHDPRVLAYLRAVGCTAFG